MRNGVRTSRPGYGLKELESFLQLERRAEVKDGGTSIVVFEEWMRTRDDALLRQIDDYNREDCIATHELRDWLLERRDEVIETYRAAAAAPEPKPPKPTPPEKEERAALRERLLVGRPRADRTAARLPQPGAQARVVGVLRPRADDAGRAVRRCRLDRRPRSSSASREQVKRSLAYTLTYPAQQQKIGEGQNSIDPATRKSPGDIIEHDREARRIVLKRGKSYNDIDLPTAIIPGRPYDTPCQEEALERIGKSLLAGDNRYPALESILAPRPVRSADPDDRPRRARAAAARPRRRPPGHPGSARVRQDLDVGAADRTPDRRRQDGRRRVDEPQGDPQSRRARSRMRRRRPGSPSTA